MSKKNHLHQVTSPFLFPKEGVNTPSTIGVDNIVNMELERLSRGSISSAIFTARQQLIDEINSLYETRNTNGWDGYDAIPISKEAKKTAINVLGILPLEILPPEIIPTSDGGYSFEWRKGDKYLAIEAINNEVSCVLIDAERKRKKSSYTENFECEYDDISKWVKDEFPLND